MNKEIPFTMSGHLTTIKRQGMRFSIQCPECSFIFYATYDPGSCISIHCTECQSTFMGIVYCVDCGECEQRLKCFGLRSVPFKRIPESDPPIKINMANTIMLADYYFKMREVLRDPNLFKGVITNANTK